MQEISPFRGTNSTNFLGRARPTADRESDPLPIHHPCSALTLGTLTRAAGPSPARNLRLEPPLVTVRNCVRVRVQSRVIVRVETVESEFMIHDRRNLLILG